MNTENPETENTNVVELTTTPTATTKKTPAKRNRKAAVRAASKSTVKRIKEPARKTASVKRSAGEKAQTQVDKHLSKWFNSLAKEKTKAEGEKVRRADVIRQAILKGAKSMGYKSI